MKAILFSLALALGWSQAVLAQSLYNDSSIMMDFSAPNITKALQQLGYSYRMTSSQPAEIEVELQAPRAKMMLRPDCRAGSVGKITCAGLTIYIVMPPSGTMQAINGFNGRTDAASVFAVQVNPQSEAIVLKRFLFAESGMPFGSFRGNLNQFRAAYIEWLKFSASAPSAPGP